VALEGGHLAEALDLELADGGEGRLGLGDLGVEPIEQAARRGDGGAVDRHLHHLDRTCELFEHDRNPSGHQFE
jgi:hypothetical protein